MIGIILRSRPTRNPKPTTHSPQPGTRHSALVLFLAAALLSCAGVAHAQGGQPSTAGPVSIRDVGFNPHLDAQVPLDLQFNDEAGRSVRLRDYFSGVRPVLLTLNYYDCQNLCPLELQNLVDTMDELPFRLGNEYTAVTVSFDPTNTAQDASQMKAQLLHRYARPDVPDPAAGWHFLTGGDASIKQLTQAVGFRYAYDPNLKDYAHPVGALLLTPDGRIARYLYGMDFPVNDLRLALTEAPQRKISGPVEAILLLCYHYSPTMGRYSAVALGAVRAGGVVTLLGLGLFLGVMWRRELVQNRRPPSGSAG